MSTEVGVIHQHLFCILFVYKDTHWYFNPSIRYLELRMMKSKTNYNLKYTNLTRIRVTVMKHWDFGGSELTSDDLLIPKLTECNNCFRGSPKQMVNVWLAYHFKLWSDVLILIWEIFVLILWLIYMLKPDSTTEFGH